MVLYYIFSKIGPEVQFILLFGFLELILELILRKKIMLFVLLASLAGCAAVPVMNVENAPVTSVSNRSLSSVQVRDAIFRAGTALGWQMKDINASTLQGTLHLRSHVAVVEIPYTSKEYSVVYKSSVNLTGSLFGSGLGLDSLDMLEIALVVEQRFGIKLRADSPNTESIFSSLQSLSDHINQSI